MLSIHILSIAILCRRFQSIIREANETIFKSRVSELASYDAPENMPLNPVIVSLFYIGRSGTKCVLFNIFLVLKVNFTVCRGFFNILH